MGKLTGKISTNNGVNAGRKNDVPKNKEMNTKERKLTIDEMRTSIKQMVEDIYAHYTYEQCLLIVPTSDDIPPSLYNLLKGDGVNGLAVWNLPIYYHDYQRGKYDHGKYDLVQFFNDLQALREKLVCDFAEVIEMFAFGSIERRGGKDCERA